MTTQEYDLPDDMVIWRYMSITQLYEICHLRRLRLTPLTVYLESDGYEGGPTSIDYISPHPASIQDGKTGKDLKRSNELTEEIRQSLAATCWRQDSDESLMMWKLYGADNMHYVAIKSTVERLKSSVGNEFFKVGKVNYFDMNDRPMGNTTLDSIALHKQKCFEYEQEIRGWTAGDPSRLNDERWNVFPIQPEVLIDSVILNRKCDQACSDLIMTIAPLGTVKPSTISTERSSYLSPLEMMKLPWLSRS